jgi:hypothetical protein
MRLQHGVGPTDYRQERTVAIRSPLNITKTSEWFTDQPPGIVAEPDGRRVVNISVPGGGVRIVELMTARSSSGR